MLSQICDSIVQVQINVLSKSRFTYAKLVAYKLKTVIKFTWEIQNIYSYLFNIYTWPWGNNCCNRSFLGQSRHHALHNCMALVHLLKFLKIKLYMETYLESANIKFIAKHVLHHSPKSNQRIRSNPMEIHRIQDRDLFEVNISNKWISQTQEFQKKKIITIILI